MDSRPSCVISGTAAFVRADQGGAQEMKGIKKNTSYVAHELTAVTRISTFVACSKSVFLDSKSVLPK